ncbi:ABC transporter ATP-binding protein [Phototrophicus methaneseepsis]|uniref:ABC transporter ATP-binding protein n=1 Tax=Phototrophicus methaneseepsis TaxID=2710758 RepID=A0A7S8EBZ7_9CHLR|nr:ABC transporter ATP-binding protein [Phototrophicus methaneseepsis]QPC83948.1 ABC transporter ATP-binding protein [Phototrophicus methaneseepsis]
MLKLQDVSRRFGGLQALSDVTITVPDGRVVGLIGPNGAGKTTLINVISGLDHPTSGTIHFDGMSIQKMPPHKVTRLGIARTYQNIHLFGEMTTRENLMVAQHKRGTSSILSSIFYTPAFRRETHQFEAEADALLDQFRLQDVAEAPAESLPYGDQRRLEMARAFATEPRLLLLDEPTAGMNPTETRALGDQILMLMQSHHDLSVLVIEHDMSLIHQVCDEVYVLNFGKIIAHGTPAEIRDNPIVVEAYLGKEDSELI